MKGVALALAVVGLTAPALAQTGDSDIDALMKKYVAAFNKGDVAQLAADVYDKGDAAAIKARFDKLRSEEFGKLDVYGFKACPVVGDKTKVEMRYAVIFTYRGTMNGDEVKLFDLVKTPAGWRIGGESDVKYDSTLSCG